MHEPVIKERPILMNADISWAREEFWLFTHGNTYDGLGIEYRDGQHKFLPKKPAKHPKLCKWHPAIRMPRWAARNALVPPDLRQKP